MFLKSGKLNSQTIFETLFLIAFLIIILPWPTLADAPAANTPTNTSTNAPDYGLNEAIQGTGLANTPIAARVSVFINAIIGFVGVIFLILMIYGGLTWMTAGGNQEKVGKATKIIVNSTIGIVIVMLSYAISYYIIKTVAGV